MLLARSGRMAEAKALAAMHPAASAAVLLQLGDADAAFARIQDNVNAHRESVVWFPAGREWEGYRDDPRFKTILLRMGIPGPVREDRPQ